LQSATALHEPGSLPAGTHMPVLVHTSVPQVAPCARQSASTMQAAAAATDDALKPAATAATATHNPGLMRVLLWIERRRWTRLLS
jgi:hypothetical protein